MFDRDELEKVIDLQQRSYRLLLWINRAFIRGRLSLTRLHGPMSEQEAAAEWLDSVYDMLPTDARPENRGDLARFASLLVSYLHTSFEPVSTPMRISRNGCMCPLCSYLAAPTRLVPRRLTRKANLAARRLKVLALGRLCDELGLPLLGYELDAMIDDPSFPGVDLVWFTYGLELLRRSEFASQGEGVFALWRQIVHHEHGAGRRAVQLNADRFVQAERAVAEYLRARAAAA
jgi:hypothetical protein